MRCSPRRMAAHFIRRWTLSTRAKRADVGGGGGWHKASVSDCLPLAAPIGLSPLLILTLCGPERVLVVSTEPPDDLSCLTTPGVGRPRDGAVARAADQMHTPSPCGGLPTPALTMLGGGGIPHRRPPPPRAKSPARRRNGIPPPRPPSTARGAPGSPLGPPSSALTEGDACLAFFGGSIHGAVVQILNP